MLKEYYKRFIDIAYACFLWVLFSFLGILITFGAASCAMFRVVFQTFKTKEPTNVMRLFSRSFKENLIISTLVWLILVALFIPLYLMYLYAVDSGKSVFLVLSIVGFYQLLVIFIFSFPLIAVFKTKNNLQMIKNILIMANSNLLTNIKLIGSLAFSVFLVLYVHQVLIVLAIPLYAFLIAFHLKKIIDPMIISINDDKKGD